MVAIGNLRRIEHLLNRSGAQERRLLRLARADRGGEALVVRLDRIIGNVAPVRGVEIAIRAGAQIRTPGIVDHLDRTLLAIDAQPELVELTGGCAARLN